MTVWILLVAPFSPMTGCASVDRLHPFAGERGVLVPIENPDGLVRDPRSLSLYLGDAFNSRKEGGQVLFGHPLNRKFRKFLGAQVSSVCRSLPCYVEATRSWKRTFILSARIEKNDDAANPEGVLTLTRWSVSPFMPQTTVIVPFLLGNGDPPYEQIVEKGVGRIVDRISRPGAHSAKDMAGGPGAVLADMISRGEIDRALRFGERICSKPSGKHLSKAFFLRLYSLEESAGKLEMAERIGKMAISMRLASPVLFSKMAQNARERGNHSEEANVLFQGLGRYPNDQVFWRNLIRELIRNGHYGRALTLIHRFDERNPPVPSHPHFAPEVYAVLVATGKGEDADMWFRTYLEKGWTEATQPSPFLAHAIMTRHFQRGEWRKAEQSLNGLMGRGVESALLYQDLMTALGAENEPIVEAHVGRKALSRGFRSQWIRNQVSYLEQKGY